MAEPINVNNELLTNFSASTAVEFEDFTINGQTVLDKMLKNSMYKPKNRTGTGGVPVVSKIQPLDTLTPPEVSKNNGNPVSTKLAENLVEIDEEQVRKTKIDVAARVALLKKGVFESLIGPHGEDYDEFVKWLKHIKQKAPKTYLDLVKHVLPKTEDIEKEVHDPGEKAPIVIAIGTHIPPQDRIIDAKVG